jgi:hypothetical protein
VSRSEEAHLLYALLAAAEEEQRLPDSAALAQWQRLKHRFNRSHPARTHGALVAFFEDVERKEVFAGTWIEFKWRRAKADRARKSASGRADRSVTHS